MTKEKTHTNFLRNRFHFGFTLLILLGLTFSSHAQNFIFNNITSDDGLPSTSVTDVAQDTYGFIYLGTWDGVYQFDGKSYKKIYYEGRYVEADDKGGVWIEAQDGNLVYYDSNRDSLTFYTEVDSRRRYIQVLLGKQGEVFASTSKGIMKLDPNAQKFILEPGQEEGAVWELNLGEDGRINFLSTIREEGIAKIGTRTASGEFSYEQFPKDENTKVQESFASSYPTIILPYGKSGTVLLNLNGLAIRESNAGPWIFKKVTEPEILKEKGFENDASYLLLDQFLWLNQRNAITRINVETGKSLTIHSGANTHKELLPMSSDHGCRLFLDRQGVLWIPKFAYGISLLNTYQSDFGLLRDEKGKVIPDILSSYELSDGSFWVGQRISFERSLIHFSSDRKTILHRLGDANTDLSPLANTIRSPGKSIGSELTHPYPWGITQTADSVLWVGTGSPGTGNGGLNRIDPKTGLITRYRNDPKDTTSLGQNWVLGILKDPRDKLWINHTGGVDFFDPETEIFEHVLKDPSGSGFRGVLIDFRGNILIQDNERLNSWLLIDTKTKSIVKKGNLFGQDLRFVSARPYQDQKGRIWIASVDGFGFTSEEYDGLKFWLSYEGFGYPDMEINAFSDDDEGNVYFASSEGIFQYNPETGKTIRFGSERGLQSNLFNTKLNNRGSSGKIYFTGNGGMNVFDPKELKTNPYPPQILLRGINLDGKSYQTYLDSAEIMPTHTISSLTIPPGITTLNINFASIHFGGNGKNNAQYRLLNFDDTWQEAGSNGSAVFTNLPPGDYALELKSVNLDGIWNESPLQISIKVLPPWYQTWWAYLLYFGLFALLAYGFIQEQRRRAARKERELAKDRELAQAKEIEKAYSELKSTQAQLIQSEKMASLGELTAGIAHEIQNPLNFVNNFSEVSNELLDEMDEEIQKQDWDEVKAIKGDLKDNLSKITQHGKRADAIVKSMLEHSKKGTGKKEEININALAEEFLGLSYQSFLAKEPEFSCELKTELNPNLGKVSVIPQDLGKVFQNLFNNAFYACAEKAKSGIKDYNPEVILRTRKTENGIEISVQDNGNGIPESIKDKVFQPFFTTKPTGSGTGLGLSLSYDIVKAHGGELKVQSEEEKGTKFTVNLKN